MSKNQYANKWLHEAMHEFERLVRLGKIHVHGAYSFDREKPELARMGYYYCHGELNAAFVAFLQGLLLGRIFWKTEKYQ